MWPLLPLLLLGLLRPCAAEAAFTQRCDSSTDGTIYKYHAKTLNGSHTVNLSDYRGRSVLFVNVATY
ncbi:glutathione peroxidase 3 [Lates japonicus]|uniref:Glutathione peroxidase 3 n=1 Tax=Lates japonicus TaxID=270547 RepID=A0AAD3MYV9_LATJO|nr:glutathione peroxidase 3 [Lates japonicus]